ncbi:hypothetical protein QBC38DRAFT_83220 [Podospora fimiseda]|uniref:Uncharacterized protein n=1 Tax=Podospora fimiseda TaxID=252190 RepID=A0AAN6YNJ1_9PEZI|nr:hypothetical protein QBC38DRAFT_83220 [Podospora fimiseda]
MHRDNDGKGPFQPNEDLMSNARHGSRRLQFMVNHLDDADRRSAQVPWAVVPKYEIPPKDKIPAWLPKIGAKAQQQQQPEKPQERVWEKTTFPRSASTPTSVVGPAPRTRVAQLRQQGGVASHNLPPHGPPHTRTYAKVAAEKQETVVTGISHNPRQQSVQNPGFAQGWDLNSSAGYYQHSHPQQQTQSTMRDTWQRTAPGFYQPPPGFHQPPPRSHPELPFQSQSNPSSSHGPSRQPLMAFSGDPPPQQPSSSRTAYLESAPSTFAGTHSMNSGSSSSAWKSNNYAPVSIPNNEVKAPSAAPLHLASANKVKGWTTVVRKRGTKREAPAVASEAVSSGGADEELVRKTSRGAGSGGRGSRGDKRVRT